MYPNIDMKRTGQKLKELITAAGYDVKYVQNYLHLSCPQPVYRWFKGKTLPTVNHLYALSRLLKVHMEDLLVSERQPVFLAGWERFDVDAGSNAKRLRHYYDRLLTCA